MPDGHIFDTFGIVGAYLGAPGEPEEVVERAVTVSRVARRTQETPPVGTRVLMALELQAQDRLAAYPPEVLKPHVDVFEALTERPSLDLDHHRQAIFELALSPALDWQDALFFSWILEGTDEAATGIQPLLERPGASEAIKRWYAANVHVSETPWGESGA